MKYRSHVWPDGEAMVSLVEVPDESNCVGIEVEDQQCYHFVGYIGDDGRLHLCTHADDGEDGCDIGDLGLQLDADGYIEVVYD